MVTRIGGNRRKTRGIFTKPRRQRGKMSLRNYLQGFEKGERVAFKAEPAVQSGIYYRRFHGFSGLINRKLGSCYEVLVSDHNKEKRVIVHPVHLKRA